LCGLNSTGEQTCIDHVDDIQQIGSDEIGEDRIVVVPHLSFTCNGRISNIRVRITSHGNGNDNPYIDIWRPSPGSHVYNLVTYVQIRSHHISRPQVANILEADISLIDSDRIVFQSGDVIAFYIPRDSLFRIRTITRVGYALYIFSGLSASSLNLTNADIIISARQPIIQFTLGKYLHILAMILDVVMISNIIACQQLQTFVSYNKRMYSCPYRHSV